MKPPFKGTHWIVNSAGVFQEVCVVDPLSSCSAAFTRDEWEQNLFPKIGYDGEFYTYASPGIRDYTQVRETKCATAEHAEDFIAGARAASLVGGERSDEFLTELLCQLSAWKTDVSTLLINRHVKDTTTECESALCSSRSMTSHPAHRS